MVGKIPGYSPLTIMVNQCTGATITPSAPEDTIDYTILGGTISKSLTSFTSSNISCFTYQLYHDDQTTLVSPLPSYISLNYP